MKFAPLSTAVPLVFASVALGLVGYELVGYAHVAHAQVGHQGRISTRSDVHMSIEGALGTSGKKLDALAKTLGTPLGEIKRCYAELVKERPDVVGTVNVDVQIPEGT